MRRNGRRFRSLGQPYRGQQKVGVGLPVILHFENDKCD